MRYLASTIYYWLESAPHEALNQNYLLQEHNIATFELKERKEMVVFEISSSGKKSEGNNFPSLLEVLNNCFSLYDNTILDHILIVK